MMNNISIKKITLSMIIGFLVFGMRAQEFQDCESTFPICDLKTYHIGEMLGEGKVTDDLSNLRCSQNMTETNAFWFSWRINHPGTMTFVISPNEQKDDIDFILFKRANKNCDDMEEVRCMASGRTYGDGEADNSGCEGKTGLSIKSLDDFEKAGCKFNDDNYLKFLQVGMEEEYVLMVNNYNSKSGFSITFEGDCVLTPQSGCNIFSINDPVVITELYPNPTQELLNVEFISETDVESKLTIMNMSGELNLEVEIKTTIGLNENILDVSRLSPGSYLLHLIQGEYTTVKQFIKQ
jgi:hypothetical protein